MSSKSFAIPKSKRNIAGAIGAAINPVGTALGAAGNIVGGRRLGDALDPFGGQGRKIGERMDAMKTATDNQNALEQAQKDRLAAEAAAREKQKQRAATAGGRVGRSQNGRSMFFTGLGVGNGQNPTGNLFGN